MLKVFITDVPLRSRKVKELSIDCWYTLYSTLRMIRLDIKIYTVKLNNVYRTAIYRSN